MCSKWIFYSVRKKIVPPAGTDVPATPAKALNFAKADIGILTYINYSWARWWNFLQNTFPGFNPGFLSSKENIFTFDFLLLTDVVIILIIIDCTVFLDSDWFFRVQLIVNCTLKTMIALHDLLKYFQTQNLCQCNDRITEIPHSFLRLFSSEYVIIGISND